MTLISTLRKQTLSLKPFIVFQDGRSFTAKQIVDFYDNSRSTTYYYRRKRVVLQLESDFAFFLALIVLDGLCGEILLSHPEDPVSVSDNLARRFIGDVVLHEEDVLSWSDETNVKSIGNINYGKIEHEPLLTKWIIPTSGTTGGPKLIPHTFQSLTRTIGKQKVVDPMTWGFLYGPTRFAGLQVFFHSVLNGSCLLIPKSRSDMNGSLAFFSEFGCSALSATPSMWRKLLMSPAHTKLSLRQITLGGEIVDQSVIGALQALFPDSRIVHIYASTEAGAAFSVQDGLAGFPLSWLSTPPKGIALKVSDGVLWIRVPGRDVTNLEAVAQFDNDGFLNTGDRVETRGNRVFFLGRLNGSINVGGNKVSPEEVEGVLQSHPATAMARVSGRLSPLTGSIVVASIVIRKPFRSNKNMKKVLFQYCRDKLPSYKVPGLIRFVNLIDVTSSGKIERKY